MRYRYRCAICIAVLFLAALPAGVARAGVAFIIPPEPTDMDNVVIRVDGGYPDGCWMLAGHECGAVGLFSIPISVQSLDTWEPGLGCAAVYVPYQFFCPVGQLEPGHYVVTVTETMTSLREPGVWTSTTEFDVIAAVETTTGTWSDIKMIHR